MQETQLRMCEKLAQSWTEVASSLVAPELNEPDSSKGEEMALAYRYSL